MAGGKILLAIEWDDNAVETYRLNFPGTDIFHGDIAKLSVEEILNRTKLRPGDLDLFDGSPPCQGFSTAGKRSMTDNRNQLFREYCRILRGLQPKTFIMENVSGMVKGQMKLVFAEILRELKTCGYRVSARLLNAMHYGVPQSRERMIFVGVRSDLDFEPSHPKGVNKLISFREAVQGLSETDQDEESQHLWVDEVSRKTKWIVRAGTLKQGEKLVPDVASSCRIWWDKPCPTIQKNAMPNQPPYVRNSSIHPSQPRTLSIREMARCQSFPDTFLFVDPLRNGMQRIGNSVPPLLMKAVATHLKTHILDKIHGASQKNEA
jgi:DNA (cytosine-5)-methyltransferase 1